MISVLYLMALFFDLVAACYFLAPSTSGSFQQNLTTGMVFLCAGMLQFITAKVLLIEKKIDNPNPR